MAQFLRLKDKFVVINYMLQDLQTSYSVNNDEKGIAYYNATCLNRAELYSVIPERYRKDFYFSFIKINAEIPPHTDSADRAVINFYINPGECRTQFYNFNTATPETTQVKNQTDGFLFDHKDLIKTDSFVATPNEAWLLNTTQPHHVIPPENFTERTAAQLGTTLHSFDAVVDMLKETGNL
jgi:hypothetical protein